MVAKSDDKAGIDDKTQALVAASQKLGEKIYADAQAKNAQGAPQPEAASAGSNAEAAKEEGNVVDAEYTEVKDKKSA